MCHHYGDGSMLDMLSSLDYEMHRAIRFNDPPDDISEIAKIHMMELKMLYFDNRMWFSKIYIGDNPETEYIRVLTTNIDKLKNKIIYYISMIQHIENDA